MKDVESLVVSDVASGSESGIRDFPVWHFSMLNDHVRNAAIESMIAKLDLKGKIVFEIGTGAGLIALLFAKYGAEHVFTCEMNKTMQCVAQESIEKSEFNDKITLLKYSSTEVVEQQLLPVTPDIIFSETLDCGVVGEGFAFIKQDIQKIAGPQTVVLPQRIDQYGILVSAPELDDLNTVKNVCGFNFEHLNRFSTKTYFPVRPELYETEALSSEALLRTYSYLDPEDSNAAILRTTSSAEATGIISWFRVFFGNYSCATGPQEGSHWHCAYHPFPRPLMVKRGSDYAIRIAQNGAAAIEMLVPQAEALFEEAS